jgi:GT2 family glycosyltransferase
MGSHKVCIIILNWNGKELLKDCLSSIFKLTDYPNYKVIVVDNGSTDSSVEFVKKNFPKADVLPLDKNYGFPKGNNIGIKYALKKYKPKYILLLNNDTKIIQKDWLTKLVETAKSDEKIGIVGCNLIFPDGSLQHYGLRYLSNLIFPTFIERRPYINFVLVQRVVLATNGACFMVKSEIVRRYNLLYDEIFTPASHEDIDYFWRLFKLGFFTIQRYDVKIIHKLSLSWNRQVEDFRFWLISRNNFLFLLKHFKQFLLLGMLSRFITCIFDKKDEKPLSLKNIRIRHEFYKKVFILIKAFTDAIKTYYFHKRYKIEL